MLIFINKQTFIFVLLVLNLIKLSESLPTLLVEQHLYLGGMAPFDPPLFTALRGVKEFGLSIRLERYFMYVNLN